MSLLSQSLLEQDGNFANRTRACITDQSAVFLNDTRGDIKALAETLLRGDGGHGAVFLRMLAGAPGFADAVETEDGIDSSQITDDQILSAVQAEYPTVAALYFTSDGTPIPPA